MDFAGMNWIAVIAAAVVGMITGAVWYGVFAKPWMAAAGLTEADIAGEDGKPKMPPHLYAISAAAQLLIAIMLAGIIGHLGTGQVTMWNGIVTAFFVWLGFVITTMLVNNSFQMKPLNLTVIDGGHWLVGMLLQGAVIGLIGV